MDFYPQKPTDFGGFFFDGQFFASKSLALRIDDCLLFAFAKSFSIVSTIMKIDSH